MSVFRVHNTLTRRLEEFQPLEPGHARLYTCGPTVYNYAHIGNFRAYVFEDLLRRWLKFKGFRVTQVMNLTDVDDKTIRDSQAAGLSLAEFTARYKQAFFEDIRVLNIEAAEHYPAATDHIPEMIALIQVLQDKGYAYRADDGSVYFSIDRWPQYGKLAHLDRSGLRAGVRVNADEYDKENVADFALWKAWDEKDGDVAWDSPWGRGRPGWHIECSAMSQRYLGPSFDIHTGGVDNIFPHHEDEIAQSEAATGQPFATYWLHCAHLLVDGQKMSKSRGNFHTLRDVLQRGYTGREVRYELLATHYRASLNFTFASLDAARTALRRVDEFTARLTDAAGSAASAELPTWARLAATRFEAAMDEDLNISAALAALFDAIREGNAALDARALAPSAAAAVQALLARWDTALGVLAKPATAIPADVQALLDRRQAARTAKDWAQSDALRGEIANLGWNVKDTPKGQVATPR
ncbi:MAG TPA: cysteine--tRNA ligase [Kiritimatiellia bacterium]|nr:cysteine--tRNA ligase [Kiritimatiellia bacterium]HOU58887.1 cysteine--tRNA ligase [Kiritimatiellia bacterium]HPV47584.1 cysteine--tRNA ligase [Kiritimatiellia bacterium]HQF20789.1 cysteine--tRNA ligase [Kiritimatiellia bacterium]HQG74911.1 cysteine--tRNA ligase [Kiritimatiellia bacterium]